MSLHFRLAIILSIILLSLEHSCAQYFQQDVAYEINASLDSNHTILATTDISYTNNSPQDLDTIFIHLWANAFSDKLSAYSNQAIRNGSLDYYFAPEEQMGGYRDLIISVDGKKMELYSWDNHKDVVYFILPKPLQPKESIIINTAYELKLPKHFSRMGWKKNDDYLMYWYPTPAVYDEAGWHPMPYLSMGEFYTEIANYNIYLNSPARNILTSTPSTVVSPQSYKMQGNNMIDYAIITSKNKKVNTHTIALNDRAITLKVMSKSMSRDSAILEYTTNAIQYFEHVIGPFPTDHISIFDKGANAKSGMEYPGLVTVSGEDESISALEYYVVHELLHQYFYSALAFDQRQYAWLDEGLTTYYQQRYYKEVLGIDFYSARSQLLMYEGQAPFLQHLARGQACRHYHAPLSQDVSTIDPVNYGLNAYEVPARMFAYLQSYLGNESFDNGLAQFYENWKGKHPQPEDLQKTLEYESNKDLSWFFGELINDDWAYDYTLKELNNNTITIRHESGSAPPYPLTITTVTGNEKTIWIDGHTGDRQVDLSDYTIESVESAIIDKEGLSMDIDINNNSIGTKRPLKITPMLKLDDGRYREIYFAPTFSYNTSDGGMIGLGMTNSTFPPKKIKWALSPAYGFSSGAPVGEGWVSYDQYLSSKIYRKIYRKIQYKFNAKSYSFRNSESLDLALRYTRISPHVSLHFHHDPIAHKYSKAYIKPIILNEEYFDFQAEDVFIRNRTNALVRLGYEYYDFWSLGPSDFKAYIEYHPYTNLLGENHSYSKLDLTYSKSFKYAPTQSIDFRIWGSYFFTNTQRESANFDGSIVQGSSALIYQGFNDYAYDDYFFNRANQNVRLDNQVSYGGGGFKTPLGSQYNLGQTNDFALALNVKSDLPIKMPKFLPLKLFLDIGYARSKETKEQPLRGQTLYSGGAMLEFGEGLFSIYLPLFNSEAINDIYETEGVGLLGKISFKLDLVRFNPWDIAEDYTF